MKIGPLDTKPVGSHPAERKGVAPAAHGKAEPSAQVDLSPAATQLAGAGSDPTFDASKVDRIATAIRQGKFSVNHEAIADKLIANATELVGRKGS
jgi:negative regulator of flagellin synthesis FlgM